MATDTDYRNAARTLPSKRTSAQQDLVNNAYANGMTTIKNLDHEAQRQERIGG